MKQRDGNMESGAAPSADSAEVEARPSLPAARPSPPLGLSRRCPRPMASTKSAFCAKTPPGTSCTGGHAGRPGCRSGAAWPGPKSRDRGR